jgi:hypothetical protein
VPYDIPDFRREEDLTRWESDTLSPFWNSDGTPPSMPCCSRSDYAPSAVSLEKFRKALTEK